MISGSNPNDSFIQTHVDFNHASNLPFNGNDVIELYYEDTLLDQFGLLGFDINFALDLTMIRLGEKESYTGAKSFNAFNYIAYVPDAFKYLKNDDHETLIACCFITEKRNTQSKLHHHRVFS